MCLGGGGGRMTTPQREYQNRPVTVTGKQTGVDNAKDTAKATESLMIKRQKEEGTYVDPNLTTVEKLRTGSGGNKTAQQKANIAANRKKAQNMATARLRKKYSKGIQGRKTGVA
tara:strand:+ start:172 stop:513 length:342 start_codon:yes stop_codon:yes gene_type:complete